MTGVFKPRDANGPSTARVETLYDRIGGRQTFTRLVDMFYEGVAEDPVLRPMYPEHDLGGARHRMTTFLEQYWGGPRTYGEERGHPRLRMRHEGFAIDDEARALWLVHMRSALDRLDIAADDRDTLWDYLHRAAISMVNR